MKSINAFLLQPLIVFALANSASAQSINLDNHPLETTANVTTDVVSVTRGVVKATGGVVRTVGEVITQPLRGKKKKQSTADEMAESQSAKIYCDFADSDLRTLNRERGIQATQLERGKNSVTPGVEAARILKGDYEDGNKVQAAEYIFALDERVSDIHRVCNIP